MRALRALGALGLLAALALSAWALPAAYAVQRDDYRSLVAEVAARAGPDDAIVALMELDEPVRYYYRGPLPVHHLLARGDFAETARRLDETVAGRAGVWLVSFGEDWADPARFVRHSLAARALEPPFDRWYGNTRLTGYRLDPSRPFSAEPTPAHPAGVRYDPGVELIGWDVVGGRLVAGREGALLLHWRALEAPVRDFKVLATVHDSQDHELARADALPATLAFGPWSWPAGRAVTGEARLTLPATTPPGRYRLRIGVYDPGSLRELAAFGPDGAPLGTRVDVGAVEVAPAHEPPPDEALPLPRLDPPADFALDGQPTLRLLGRDLGPAERREGETLDLALAWRALRAPGADLQAVLRLRGDAGLLGEVAFAPTPEHPTGRWSDGDLFVAWQRVALPPEVPGGQIELEIGLRDGAGRWLEPVGAGGPFVSLGSLSVRERPVSREAPPMQHRVDATLGDRVRLLGYDLDLADARPGGTLRLTLYWQALGRTERAQKVFNHLVDAEERFVGQEDSEPLGGGLPTTLWKSGEVVADAHAIPIRPEAAPGRYRLKVGLYDPVSGERLPVTGGAAGDPPTFVLLGEVEVGR